MPAITFHGGPVIAHVEVSTVFYGQSWNTSDPSAVNRGSLNQFQADITQSPYMAMLGEYGVGRGKLVSSDNVTGPARPATGRAQRLGDPDHADPGDQVRPLAG